MNKILVSISIIFILLPAMAQNSQFAVIEKANQAYNDGAFTEAVDLYHSVIDSGYMSASLYYNLGNAYFKSKDIPSSILYYEKALKLDPKDEQIRFNLNIANSQITDKIEEVPEMFYIRWWKALTGLFGPNIWARIAIVLFIIMLCMATIFVITRNMTVRRFSFWAGSAMIILLVISFYIAYQKYNQQNKDNFGIIFSPTITVKSSPATNSVDLFVIHEGTKVEILDQVEGWYEIKIANGSLGWLPQNILRKI